MKTVKKSRLFLFLAIIATAPLLTACGTSCDCPKCGATTVVTPDNGQTTVVRPNN